MTTKDGFFKLVHSYRFRLYLLQKLPAAFFSGVKIKECDNEKCVTEVPYKWLTQNPFRSTYFASLAMAAEMSTGILALSNIYKNKPAMSMLLITMEANYYKKATGTTFFTCNEGKEISKTISEAYQQEEAKIFKAHSLGRNKIDEVVAEFYFSWSFKKK